MECTRFCRLKHDIPEETRFGKTSAPSAVATFSHATNIGLSASSARDESSEVDAFESSAGDVAALIRRFDEVTNGS